MNLKNNEELNYDQILEYTVFNIYPDYYMDQLVESLESESLIIVKKRVSKKIKELKEEKNYEELGKIENWDKMVDLSRLSKSRDILYRFIREKPSFDFKKFIEEYEFHKGYRHAVLYKMSGFCLNVLDKLEDDQKVHRVSEDGYDSLQYFFKEPTVIRRTNEIIFKFSIIKKGYVNESDTKLMKYPVIVVVDIRNNTLEIRFDKVKSIFQSGKAFYEEIVKQAVVWIKQYLEVEIKPLELRGKIGKIIEAYNKDMANVDIIPMKRNISLRDGSKVVLDIDANKEFVAPIIGNIKFILDNNKEELKNAPNVSRQLESIIRTVDNGDVPKVNLYWKESHIMIGIIHDYREKKYSLIQYFGEIEDSEKMDYVRKYFSKD